MSIHEKLMKIQTEIKAPKNLYNSFGKYKYRNAEGILEAIKPYLKENNCSLVISDSIEYFGGKIINQSEKNMYEAEGRIYVKATATLIDNESGEKIEAHAYARETDEKKGMDSAQVTGATSSYARKYCLNGLFLLDDTKDPDSDEYKIASDAKKAEAEQTAKAEKNMQTYPKSEADATKPASEKQVNFCISLLQKAGIDLQKVYDGYGIKDLSELTAAQAQAIINKYNK